jgi:hypothetical protein
MVHMNATEALRAVLGAIEIAIDPDLANFGLGGLGFDSDDVRALLRGAAHCEPSGAHWILACQYEGSVRGRRLRRTRRNS